MKRKLMILGMTVCVTLGHAQNDNRRSNAFEDFRREIHSDFDDFRKSIMEEYAEFVSNPWKEFKEEKPIPIPKDQPVPPVVKPQENKPDPVKPKDDPVKPKYDPVKPKIEPIKPQPIIFDEVIKPQPIHPQPQPVQPIRTEPVEKPLYKEFSLFGTIMKVRVAKEGFVLNGVSEGDVAKAIKELSSSRFDNTMVDCLHLRDSLQLCDWSYQLMLKEMSETIYGKDSNEAMLFMAYVYMRSGYKMRLASDGRKLYMLYASKHVIYNRCYYVLDGEKYYCIEDMPSTLHICEASFPKENSMSLQVNREQKFEMKEVQGTEHESNKNREMKVTMRANQNMLDFYTSYPSSELGENFVTRWAMYANMPMPEYVKKQIYAQLKGYISHDDQLTAVTKLLNWVQTGFVYGYDDKIWGRDRAFFPEESLYYPYCDCEDRAILLTRLVRDLLGLKCILIYYPNHLAAAVEITEGNPTGDYIEYKGHRFYITDGTITYGAPVGRTMRGMDNQTAKVILLE